MSCKRVLPLRRVYRSNTKLAGVLFIFNSSTHTVETLSFRKPSRHAVTANSMALDCFRTVLVRFSVSFFFVLPSLDVRSVVAEGETRTVQRGVVPGAVGGAHQRDRVAVRLGRRFLLHVPALGLLDQPGHHHRPGRFRRRSRGLVFFFPLWDGCLAFFLPLWDGLGCL